MIDMTRYDKPDLLDTELPLPEAAGVQRQHGAAHHPLAAAVVVHEAQLEDLAHDVWSGEAEAELLVILGLHAVLHHTRALLQVKHVTT